MEYRKAAMASALAKDCGIRVEGESLFAGSGDEFEFVANRYNEILQSNEVINFANKLQLTANGMLEDRFQLFNPMSLLDNDDDFDFLLDVLEETLPEYQQSLYDGGFIEGDYMVDELDNYLYLSAYEGHEVENKKRITRYESVGYNYEKEHAFNMKLDRESSNVLYDIYEQL